MSITIAEKLSRNKQRIWYYFEWGKGAGQRRSADIFTYASPKDQIQKNHNKEALAILESKKSTMILEQQSIGSGYVVTHKLKSNFLDFYEDFVKKNSSYGARHLQGSYVQFKEFTGLDFLSAADITEDLCIDYRNYLLKKYNGETPANYFREFKRVIKAGKKAHYFAMNPAEDIPAKENPNKKKKQVIEAEEWLRLINTPCLNHEVKKAFVACMYLGLRWCDVKPLKWTNIKEETVLLKQNKTGVDVEIPLHETAKKIMGKRGSGLVFRLPSPEGANKMLKQWCVSAGIDKQITWHCARLSFSVLLQDENVNTATIAGMLGHTTTRQVEETYQRYRVRIGQRAIQKLPGMLSEP